MSHLPKEGSYSSHAEKVFFKGEVVLQTKGSRGYGGGKKTGEEN